MDPKSEELLKNASEEPTRSRLEPYRDLIRELRRRRYTYRKITRLLQDSFGLTFPKSTLNDFVIACSKQRKLYFQIPPDPPASSTNSSPTQSASGPSTLPHTTSRPSGPNVPQKRFHYDPEEGLTLSEEDLNLKPRKD